MQRPKPFLLITGFLGAGKTTLLRRSLHELNARNIKADVILNDISNADIDVATLDPSLLSSVSPLAAGCACCESLEELVQLCRTASSGTGDLLIAELNGTADPLVLLETFTLLENRLSFFPRYQVCVIDARYWEKRDEFQILERRQLETAGFFYISHKNKVQQTQLKCLKKSIKSASKNSQEINLDKLVGMLQEDVSGSKNKAMEEIAPLNSNLKNSSPRNHLDDTAHKLSHRFTGCQFPLPDKVDSQRMGKLMDSLPNWVLRAKALVNIVDMPEYRWLYEKVGTELIQNPIPTYELSNAPSSLMCIGPKLAPGKIRSLIGSEFGVTKR